MKKALSLILALAFLSTSLLFLGCATDPDESTIPWSRPKEWEGGVPGMGSN